LRGTPLKGLSERDQQKKEREFAYLAVARQVCSLFPSDLQPFEEPDFVTGDHRLGVEIVELRDQEKSEHAGRLSLVIREAMRLYNSRKDVPYIRVSFSVTSNVDINDVKRLARMLSDHVYDHRHTRGPIGDSGLPVGWCQLEIADPLGIRGEGSEWMMSGAIDPTLGTPTAISSIISEKNRRLVDYRNHAHELWLLIVVDRRLSTGEVMLRPETIAGQSFKFDFEKVLIFFRDLDGGQVIELEEDLEHD